MRGGGSTPFLGVLATSYAAEVARRPPNTLVGQAQIGRSVCLSLVCGVTVAKGPVTARRTAGEVRVPSHALLAAVEFGLTGLGLAYAFGDGPRPFPSRPSAAAGTAELQTSERLSSTSATAMSLYSRDFYG